MTVDKNIFNSDQVTLLGGYQNKEKVAGDIAQVAESA